MHRNRKSMKEIVIKETEKSIKETEKSIKEIVISTDFASLLVIRSLRVLDNLPHHQMSRNPSVHPQFRTKIVCKLSCKYCLCIVSLRGMKAILLGNTRVELYSTDSPPSNVQLVENDYLTGNCRCRIRDIACLGCGNVCGYHVTQPCERCLESCNNGHFWMFHSESVMSQDRMSCNKKLLWEELGNTRSIPKELER